tara:strand:+ start:711 stop:1436 length:726 start_codon:yes stop_codon:yes gene_type:complete
MPNISIEIILGLSEDSFKNKVNSASLDNFIKSYDWIKPPKLIRSNRWDSFYQSCTDKKIDLIITLGDSRIVPENIINSFDVIGNHGAVLPHVQGGASLVWGRMLNNGEWGVSIMEIDKKIDSGRILKVKKFQYTSDCSELEFTEICDDLTVDALLEVLRGDYTPIQNSKWQLKIAKHTDSYNVVNIFKYCIDNNINIYLPPRTPEDGLLKSEWSDEFKEVFKIANDKPYPQWKQNNLKTEL